MIDKEFNTGQIMLADDDPDNRLLFQIVLKQLYPFKSLIMANDGAELSEYQAIYLWCGKLHARENRNLQKPFAKFVSK
jgi:hypothetical protein